MLLNILGHVHLTRQGGTALSASPTVPVSNKAAALLSYLCLERQPHHREHLAELLWNTPDPLRNLRVELARLKRDGVVSFPERQPMLSFQCPLDLSGWLAAANTLPEHQVLPWLAALRGLPLSGLEDLGSRQFQQWLDGQRWAISEQIERTLGSVYARFMREQRLGAAGHIQARAAQLGLRLDSQELPPVSHDWQCVWEEQRLLTGLMERATRQPQLVLLYGRSGSGKHNLIRQSVQDQGWKAIQLQATAQRPLFQEALAQQLAQLLSGTPEGPARSAAVRPDPALSGAPLSAPVAASARGFAPPRPSHPDAALIDMAVNLRESRLRLVIAIHHAAQGLPWLPEVVRFLLDLPLPLVLILSETLPTRLDAVQSRTSFVEGQRLHRLDMPPLTTRMVLQAWQVQNGATSATPPDAAQEHGRAATLIQRSEGWPLYAQALSAQAAPPSSDQQALPEQVRSALLGELSTLPRPVRAALARLSLIHDRFTPELAEVLLNQDASQVVLQAVQQGVLVPSAAHEEISLPELHHRSDDQTRRLQFAHEPLRIALAGSLTGLERQEIRQNLALYFLKEAGAHPEETARLALHYARRTGMNGLIAQAEAAVANLPDGQRGSGPAQRPSAVPSRLRSVVGAAAEPDSLPAFRREVRTPNGYRVALDGGQLELMRRGWYGPAPLLTLNVAGVPGGPFSLVARLDVFRGAPDDLTQVPAFALGLRSGQEPRTVYTPTEWRPEARSPDEVFGGVLPLGQWFSLHGQGEPGPLELSVRALDLALTVAEFRWGDTVVLPAWP